MATPQDIREWAVANEIDVNPRGPIPRDLKERFYSEQGIEEPLPEETAPVTDGVPEELTTPGEKPPASKPKAFSFGRRKKDPVTSGRRSARTSTEGLFSSIWAGAAHLLGATGMIPTARVLQLQAPVAGAILDRELRGTRIDRIAQPAARMFNKGSSVGTLVALPLMVHAVTMKPELYEVIKPHMVDALYRWYEIAGPEMKKQQERMEKRREQFGDLDPEQLLNMIFSPEVTPEAPQE